MAGPRLFDSEITTRNPLRVNVVAPEVIETPWWDEMPGPVREGVFATAAAPILTPIAELPSRDVVAVGGSLNQDCLLWVPGDRDCGRMTRPATFAQPTVRPSKTG